MGISAEVVQQVLGELEADERVDSLLDQLPQLVCVRRLARRFQMRPMELLMLWGETRGPGTYRFGPRRHFVNLVEVRKWLVTRFESPPTRDSSDPWAGGALLPLDSDRQPQPRAARGSSGGSSRGTNA